MLEPLRITDVVPDGAELGGLAAIVQDDVLGHGELDDLVGDALGDREPDPLARGPEVPRIRPILVALAARASGADGVDADLQRAAELLHAALVVHDLTIGREGGMRRRVARRVLQSARSPRVRALARDWLGGHHLTLRAMEIVAASRPDGIGELLGTLREFADGQALMQELQQGRIPTREDWQEHADTHTGALFAFCCRAGAVGGDRAHVEALGRYGRHLGRLWHIAEDVSVLSHEEGEPVLLARALAGRPLLPVVEASMRSPAVGRFWSRLVQHPSEPAAAWMTELIRDAGGLTGARERMLSESWAARQALGRLPPTAYRAALEKLVTSLAVAGIRPTPR